MKSRQFCERVCENSKRQALWKNYPRQDPTDTVEAGSGKTAPQSLSGTEFGFSHHQEQIYKAAALGAEKDFAVGMRGQAMPTGGNDAAKVVLKFHCVFYRAIIDNWELFHRHNVVCEGTSWEFVYWEG